MKSAIKIENLVKKFDDVTAVNGLNLEIEEGELFGFLGPNGAGKTTAINILCGLLKPTSGKAWVSGYDVTVEKDLAKVKEIIGVCPQEPAYYGYLTGRENVELFGSLHAMNKTQLKERTQLVLEKVGLVEGGARRAGKYSGGMIRRISLAMALVHDPAIAFLDEPTVAMDPQSRHAVWDFILDLKKQGKTVILTTHYMEEAQVLSDRVGIIDQGKLIALDTPAALMKEHGAANLEDVFINLTGRTIREGA